MKINEERMHFSMVYALFFFTNKQSYIGFYMIRQNAKGAVFTKDHEL